MNDLLDNAREQLKLNAQKLRGFQNKLTEMENDPASVFDDLEELYDTYLDDIHHDACEALPVNVKASDLINSYDPIMYRTGFSDWIDGCYDVTQREEHQDLDEAITELEEEIEELEEEIEELEEEEIDE